MFKKIATLIIVFLFSLSAWAKPAEKLPTEGHVALVEMDMLILPGTQAYLDRVVEQAATNGAKAIIVKLDTPGGILQTTQEMIQSIFSSPVPIIIYVAPTGATATSAGVFLTMAGHIAAMAPGTSIGAAHPVTGAGSDIEGDMRKKAENSAIAMVKSISKERGRNVEWAEKAVRESDSITGKEAVEKNVVDLTANNIPDLLKAIKGKKVKVKDIEETLPDFSNLPVVTYEIGLRNKVMNVIANPNIAALLWLGATTGLSLELYNPGAILPGVVGVICLILALAVMQIIPITHTGVILFILGALMLGAELFIPSGILGVGGIIALVLGAIYLIDPAQAPGLTVDLEYIIPAAVIVGGFLLWVIREVVKSQVSSATTGAKGMAGMIAVADQDFDKEGKVFVNGEIWNAVLADEEESGIKKNDKLEVVGMKNSLLLEVKKLGEEE